MSGEQLKLEPFIHQVGGHSPLFCLDSLTVCKPLEQREFNFYSSLPNTLIPFTPHFKGTMNVEVTEDQDGYITLKGLPPESYRKLYRKHSADTKPRMRLKRCKSIEIENGKPSGQYFEDELVEGEKTYNPWALKCHRENLIKIGINVFEKNIDRLSHPTFQEFILLENLTYKYKYPCVLDLKVGTRQYGDGASITKQRSKTAKVENSTSCSMGLRLGGMQVYQLNLGRYLCRSKNYGRNLSVEGLKMALRQFFCNGLVMRMDVIQTLKRKLIELRRVLEKLDSYRFYTSSLLVIYDGNINNQSCLNDRHLDDSSQLRNSLSTTSLLQLSGRNLIGGSEGEDTQLSRSLDDTSFHSAYINQNTSSWSWKRSASYTSLSSLEDIPSDKGLFSSSANKIVSVKIIDFAHSTHSGLKDPTLHEGPDRGFLLGIDSLIKTLQELQEKDKNPVAV
eukprot:TRINITY_DN6443_c0_g2_i2.p1 TRINITY_DN6443_c0_g2~~TRINITY_DN6443_c0_g2_i2.p1  ORF type:complete len:449 (+),score=91.23 TRINITY_DN6443_c0_g2_i2:94-1440(+)